jgi:Gram-negative bacterial TonB protein C-terminal
MVKLFFTIVFLCVAGLVVAQDTNSEAPIKWQRYRDTGGNISIMLPKLPTRFDFGDPCRQVTVSEYWSYAENAAYSVLIATKSPMKFPTTCKEKKIFGKETFDLELEKLAADGGVLDERSVDASGHQVIKILRKGEPRWIVNDIAHGKWVELAVFSRNIESTQARTFLSSLSFEPIYTAIDIAEGASSTLGDQVVVGTGAKLRDPTPPIIVQNVGLAFVNRPRPSYSVPAREANLKGTVVLKVTFLDNGGIGPIEVIKAVPLGLTEQAIAAAKKIVFLPARDADKNITVVKQVEYSFSIY